MVALHLQRKHWFCKQVGVLSNGDPLGVLLFGAKLSSGMYISTSRSSDRLVLLCYYHCGYKLREMGLWVCMKVINPYLNDTGFLIYFIYGLFMVFFFFKLLSNF